MSVLVVGGAGYIGAHIVSQLLDEGVPVVVADDLSTGVAERITGVPLARIDIAEADSVTRLADVIDAHGVDSIIHMAARKQVAESVARPLYYYRQNIDGLLNVLEAMERTSVDRIIFSSSAAVYGACPQAVVGEDAPTGPINPYGRTKLIGEQLIADWAASRNAHWMALRYFNVAGTASARLGDLGATNLIPMVIERLVAGQPPRVFGADYDTPDGTCIRDYVHVVDLAQAHVVAWRALRSGKVPHHIFNVGTGHGASVLEVIRAIHDVSGLRISPIIEPRRPGDPAKVVASPELLASDLGFRAERGLDEIVASAWEAWPGQ